MTLLFFLVELVEVDLFEETLLKNEAPKSILRPLIFAVGVIPSPYLV